MSKPVHELTPEDFQAYPVWEFDSETEDAPDRDETWVRPVEQSPVTDMSNRIIGTTVILNNGAEMVACLGNIELNSRKATREFLILSLWHEGRWLDLARYFDVDYDRRGPVDLGRQLQLAINDVFPIHYDISANAKGPESVLRGVIPMEPDQRLSDEERLALIFASEEEA